ncbi:MAG: choice-of-anchor D domain-containing protein [Myxococcota bacterium]
MNRALIFALVATLASACEDDNVGVVVPVVQVSPLHLDFGTVELSQESVLSVKMTDLEAVPAKIPSISLIDDCQGCFTVVNPVSQVPAASSVDLQIKFRAQRLAISTGTVTITSDDPKLPSILVTLVGRGSDSRRPDIAVAPSRVNFGFVPAGGVSVGSFVVRSTGTNTLLIDKVRIDPADAPYRITTSTPAAGHSQKMEPGAQASVSIRASVPRSETGTVTARVIIETNVLEEKNVPGKVGWVAVPLTARANLPPLALVGPDQTVEPWSRATLDGSGSHDQDNPPDDPISYRWEFSKKPDGSTTVLERAHTAQPSFWVDLAGRYEVSLVVTDALGLESQNTAVTVVEALPTNAVRIELIWDHPDADLDLHLIREGGAFCDCATDVHYRDCARTPNWFPATPGANPRLDVDDRSGFGPENINIDGDGPNRFIPAGHYNIAVHYYSSNSGISTWPTTTANATVRVYIFGLLAGQFQRALTADGDVWFAATLNWPEHTVTEDGRLSPGQTCAIF